jgi:arylsulfatase A-like enzyme
MNMKKKLVTNMGLKEKMLELPSQPDIIFIITDQERATQHFPENWEEENLPTLTKLKQNGFSFDRAFCNTCMCSPSRSTLFTGTYPAQHQVTQTLTEGGVYSPGEIQLNNQTPNIGRILDDIGYDVQYRGKWHLSKGADGGDPLAKDISLYGFKGWIGPDAGEDAKPENFGGGYPNHDARYVAEAIEYLEMVRERRKNGDMTPYCLVLSLVNPHDVLGYPKFVNYGYSEDEYTQRTIPELPSTAHEQLLRNKKPMAQFQTNIAADGLLGVLKNDDMKLNYLNFYAYLLTKIDAQIGEFIDVLYDDQEVNLANDAIVFRLADHGEMGMSHGGMRQKAFVAYEENMRIPMVISNPVLFPEGKSSDELATLVDILPTLADMVNVAVPSDVRGVSLLPIIESGEPVQEEILFTFDDTKSGSASLPSSVMAANRLRSIRTKEWKYTYYFDALGSYYKEFELYNLLEDENEEDNLAYNSDFKEIREDLHKRLKRLEETKLKINEHTFVSFNWVETNANFDTYAFNASEEIMNRIVRSSNTEMEEVNEKMKK